MSVFVVTVGDAIALTFIALVALCYGGLLVKVNVERWWKSRGKK